jgi:hypothetical protein
MVPGDDLDGDLGTLDVAAMDEVRRTVTGLDGLIETAGFENPADPRLVRVVVDDGIGPATHCRFDIRWYRDGYYSFHHTDSAGCDFRWDYHPKSGHPSRHFHPPPDAPSDRPDPSCLTVDQPPVVARAVHKLWRRAYDHDDPSLLNPPQGGL